LGSLGVHTIELGQDLTLVAPDGFGTLMVNPIFGLSNLLTNTTDISALQDFVVTAGHLELNLPGYTTPSTPPVIVDPPETCVPFTNICTDPDP
jgi:hypothetical protein